VTVWDPFLGDGVQGKGAGSPSCCLLYLPLSAVEVGDGSLREVDAIPTLVDGFQSDTFADQGLREEHVIVLPRIRVVRARIHSFLHGRCDSPPAWEILASGDLAKIHSASSVDLKNSSQSAKSPRRSFRVSESSSN
jgi:hypothetical protein